MLLMLLASLLDLNLATMPVFSKPYICHHPANYIIPVSYNFNLHYLLVCYYPPIFHPSLL